jgi:hypothetical protein
MWGSSHLTGNFAPDLRDPCAALAAFAGVIEDQRATAKERAAGNPSAAFALGPQREFHIGIELPARIDCVIAIGLPIAIALAASLIGGR